MLLCFMFHVCFQLKRRVANSTTQKTLSRVPSNPNSFELVKDGVKIQDQYVILGVV